MPIQVTCFPVCPWDCPQGRDPLLKQVITPLKVRRIRGVVTRERQEKDRIRRQEKGLQSKEGIQDITFLFSLYFTPNPATTFQEEGEGHGLICILCYC